MHRSLIAAVIAVGLSSVAVGAQQKNQTIFHGCVMPGIDAGSYVMTNVMEMPGPGGSTMPEVAHGRRILYWLDNDSEVKKHIGEMVEVRGEFTELEKSEIELKPGRQKDGGLIVEFEGPGKDVKASNADVGAAVGTAGRVAADRNDIPTFLARIAVKAVKAMGACK